MAGTVGRFQLLEPLGHGTLGALHKARDLERGRTVVLRLIDAAIAGDADRLARLLATADCVQAVSHPSIASLYEHGSDGDVVYLASEFVPGQRLADVVHGSPLNPKRALDLAVQIADGLAVAHAGGVEHGALSPRAIVLTPKGTAKLLDVGMTAWTAVTDDRRVDDFVGLGMVVFEMLAGRPIRRGWPAELKLPSIPDAVRPVLRRLLSTDPHDRYDSMALASASLRDASLRQASASAATVPPPAPEGRPRSIVLLVAAGVVIALAALAWAMMG